VSDLLNAIRAKNRAFAALHKGEVRCLAWQRTRHTSQGYPALPEAWAARLQDLRDEYAAARARCRRAMGGNGL